MIGGDKGRLTVNGTFYQRTNGTATQPSED